MPRRPRNLPLSLSIALALLLLTLWIRSYSVRDYASLRRFRWPDELHARGWGVALQLQRGDLSLSFNSADYDLTKWPDGEVSSLRATFRPGTHFTHWSVRASRAPAHWLPRFRRLPTRWGTGLHLLLPCWLLQALSLLLPTVALFKSLHRFDLRRAGRCPSCGYDLRSSPTLCPECGTPAVGPARESITSQAK